MKEITINLNEAAIGCEFCPDSDRKICSAVGDYYCPVVTLRILEPDEVAVKEHVLFASLQMICKHRNFPGCAHLVALPNAICVIEECPILKSLQEQSGD